MKAILLDGSSWHSPDDFFSALLPQLGAPPWHGHNLSALHDSLYGGMNDVEPPLTVTIFGGRDLPPEMGHFLDEVAVVFDDARRDFGADVFLEIA